ncbi:MAG: Ni/Fe hydrogenase subunit alpha [Phycisphaerae bacterium]
MSEVTIDVRHVTRVEGHGNIKVNLRAGEITHLELSIVESPRFFEAFLRGRRYDEAPHITCRICGICSIGHTTASLKGVEAACGITPSPQTIRLRKLAFYGEQLQSHILHLYFLAVPDYLGVGSVIPLAATHGDVVRRALRLKRLANDICAVVAGRHIHPIAMQAGGFTHVPTCGELRDLKRRLEAAREDWAQTAELFATLDVPRFDRVDTDYVALSNGEYAFYDGQIVSTRHPRPTPVAEYRQRVVEVVVKHSASKHCHTPSGDTYAVGALARFNNNHDRLHPAAKAAARRLGLVAPCRNPFHNNTAQLVEVVHCGEAAIELIDQLLVDEPRLEPLEKPTRFGVGVGAAEVPRGLLFHEYGVDSEGRIESVNLIIPTGQNLANIEADMRALVPQMLDAGMNQAQMTQRLEMLVRSYDPCISCATHFLDIDWAGD